MIQYIQYYILLKFQIRDFAENKIIVICQSPKYFQIRNSTMESKLKT